MVEGIIREDCIVDIVDIDVSMAKFGTTSDTPGHVEQPIVWIRVRLEGCTVNGDERPWVDLRTTVKCWKMMSEAFSLAIKSRVGAVNSKFKEHRRYMDSLRKKKPEQPSLPQKPVEEQIHEPPK